MKNLIKYSAYAFILFSCVALAKNNIIVENPNSNNIIEKEVKVISLTLPNGTVYSSYNDGQTWELENKGLNHKPWLTTYEDIKAIEFTNREGKKYISKDQGKTWHPVGYMKDSEKTKNTKINMDIELTNNSDQLTVKLLLLLAQNVSIALYDTQGNEVMIIGQSQLSIGEHEFFADLSKLSSGVYYCVAKTESLLVTKQMIFIK